MLNTTFEPSQIGRFSVVAGLEGKKLYLLLGACFFWAAAFWTMAHKELLKVRTSQPLSALSPEAGSKSKTRRHAKQKLDLVPVLFRAKFALAFMWLLANAAGLAAGETLGSSVYAYASRTVAQSMEEITRWMVVGSVYGMVTGAVYGSVVAASLVLMQSVILHRQVYRAGRWGFASVLGKTIGEAVVAPVYWTVVRFLGPQLGGGLLGGVVGVSMGLPQGLALYGQRRGMRRWLIGNTLGWAIGVATVRATLGHPSGALFGAVVGAIAAICTTPAILRLSPTK